jgi:hypothetical protein
MSRTSKDVSKSGIKGRNKHGKPTTAAKKSKQRAQKREDEAWALPNYDKPKSDDSGKAEDAWMYEPIVMKQRTTAQVKQELKNVEQELARMNEHVEPLHVVAAGKPQQIMTTCGSGVMRPGFFYSFRIGR